MSLTIKTTKISKLPLIRSNRKRYIGFTVSNLPNNFAEVAKDSAVREWFNYNGLTFISAAFLSLTYIK